jgi:hypothetical protein
VEEGRFLENFRVPRSEGMYLMQPILFLGSEQVQPCSDKLNEFYGIDVSCKEFLEYISAGTAMKIEGPSILNPRPYILMIQGTPVMPVKTSRIILSSRVY